MNGVMATVGFMTTGAVRRHSAAAPVPAEYIEKARQLLSDPEALHARIALEAARSEAAAELIAEMDRRRARDAAFGRACLGLKAEPKSPEAQHKPAVSIRKSVQSDYIVCLEDGKKLRMLKRHLMTHYNMSPDEYRAKWRLPADYPMVAPNYAQRRRTLAKKIGLGTKRAVAKRDA